MSERTGVLFSTRDDLELVTRAEELGYESVWTAEGQGKTAFGKLERWATVTSEISLATGIVNIFARTPASTAQSIATLDAHTDGRAILGLGVAHPGVIEAFHGVTFDRPLSRLDEYVELVRRYLRGDTTPFDGEYYTPTRTRFWDAFEPVRSEVPIYNAALGPGNVRLTGAKFDGWLPNLYPIDRFQDALGWLETGADRTGRSVDDIDVAMYVLIAIDDDPDVARDKAREHIAYYLRDIPGYYGRVAAMAGFEDEVERAEQAASTADAAATLSDDFVDLMSVTGTPDDIESGMQELRDTGVELPVVRAPIGAETADIERMLSVCAPR